MNCQTCNNEIPAGATNCSNCAPAQPQMAQPQAVQPQMAQPQMAQPQFQQMPPQQPQYQQGYQQMPPQQPQYQQGYQQMPPQGFQQMPQQGFQQVPPNYTPKLRMTFVLIGLFLGGLGIHNFYAGYKGKGIAQLLITVLSFGFGGFISGIWALIEICTVDKDVYGIKMQ